MSIEETYKWAKKQRAEWDSLKKGDAGIHLLDKEFSAGGDHPVRPVEFLQIAMPGFVGEVAEVRGDLIFHFWSSPHTGLSSSEFEDVLGDSFLAVFKFEDRLCADYVPELEAWAVKVMGLGQHVEREDFSRKLFTQLQQDIDARIKDASSDESL